MADVVVKPAEWKTPCMQTDFAKRIIEKLEKHFKRPMLGCISMSGIDIEYCDPDAVKQMMMKLEKQEAQIKEFEGMLKGIYKAGSGHNYD